MLAVTEPIAIWSALLSSIVECCNDRRVPLRPGPSRQISSPIALSCLIVLLVVDFYMLLIMFP